VTRHPFAGTAQRRPRRLSLSEPAGLETDGVAHEEEGLPVAVPSKARNGRWIAGKWLACCTQLDVVVFPPARAVPANGAPALGAADPNLEGKDRSGIPNRLASGLDRKTIFPPGELRPFLF
jgi:hypothetical protein